MLRRRPGNSETMARQRGRPRPGENPRNRPRAGDTEPYPDGWGTRACGRPSWASGAWRVVERFRLQVASAVALGSRPLITEVHQPTARHARVAPLSVCAASQMLDVRHDRRGLNRLGALQTIQSWPSNDSQTKRPWRRFSTAFTFRFYRSAQWLLRAQTLRRRRLAAAEMPRKLPRPPKRNNRRRGQRLRRPRQPETNYTIGPIMVSIPAFSDSTLKRSAPTLFQSMLPTNSSSPSARDRNRCHQAHHRQGSDWRRSESAKPVTSGCPKRTARIAAGPPVVRASRTKSAHAPKLIYRRENRSGGRPKPSVSIGMKRKAKVQWCRPMHDTTNSPASGVIAGRRQETEF